MDFYHSLVKSFVFEMKKSFLNSQTLHKSFTVLLLGSDPANKELSSINCKSKETFRSSWEEEYTPENDFKDYWLAHYPQLEAGLRILPSREKDKKLSYEMIEGSFVKSF